MPDTPADAMDEETFEAFLDQLRRYVRERLIPAEPQVIADNRVPDEILAEMRDMGLFALTTPAEHGGAGLGISQYIRTIRELGKPAPAFRAVMSINTGMFTTALKKGGTAEQQAEWMARSANGEIACFGLTEPDSGSDAAGLKTRATRDGNGYVLNGTKRYITNAPLAKIGLIMARTNAEPLPKNAHIGAFLIDMTAPGVSIGSPDKKMGQSGALIADVILEDVRVPGDALLGGEEGKGFLAAMQALDSGRLSVGAAALGLAERALETGLRYAMERKAFGEPIAQFQLIQAMLADSRAEIYAAECMMLDACRRAERGRASLECSAFKMFSTEMCGRVVDRVVQIHGGAGYLAEYEAERLFRDARIYRIYEGTTQIQQLVIAKQMIRDFQANG
ncbi:acyl-CoA dehydrogenase family protein [Sphingomonas immobilis]|uniref:Acyl-CoA dehydrogenase family protein n=1 Tax=Sphingomonas immobilis TaxID=3063997 RepID=A0ABT9A058_9SPHN|nr:acyl-CoA dehydrogenase family protein [Sphingomonas sp. CA1-15]MDO7842092.1 acyl-CoA dehydrogenase family protein [Sphingomonas sp. CA1-15]